LSRILEAGGSHFWAPSPWNTQQKPYLPMANVYHPTKPCSAAEVTTDWAILATDEEADFRSVLPQVFSCSRDISSETAGKPPAALFLTQPQQHFLCGLGPQTTWVQANQGLMHFILLLHFSFNSNHLIIFPLKLCNSLTLFIHMKIHFILCHHHLADCPFIPKISKRLISHNESSRSTFQKLAFH
jgi:hypothetical protein